jgi:hypothetical protein
MRYSAPERRIFRRDYTPSEIAGCYVSPRAAREEEPNKERKADVALPILQEWYISAEVSGIVRIMLSIATA